MAARPPSRVGEHGHSDDLRPICLAMYYKVTVGTRLLKLRRLDPILDRFMSVGFGGRF